MTKATLTYYSLLAVPLAILGLPLYIYLPTFYAKNIGIDMALVGGILFFARLFDVFLDPYLGYLSDKSKQRFNSRKPLVAVGAVLLIIGFYLLINPNKEYANLWLFSFSFLVYIAWSMVNIPYLTWSAEITNDYYFKTKLNSVREIGTIVGVLIALLLPFLFSISSNTKEVLDLLFIVFISLFIWFTIVSLKKIKTVTSENMENFKFSYLKNIYKELPKIKSLQIGYFFNNLANAIPATLFLLFVEFVIKEPKSSGLLLIVYFLSGVLALPVWTAISKKTSKKRVWIYSIALASSSFIFVPFLGENDFIPFLIICIISGFSLGADLAFPTSIHSDLSQKAEKIKSNCSGLLFGLWAMITKLSLALSVAISFGILGLVDFNENNPSNSSILTLALLYGLAPVILKIIAIIFINKYKEDK
ncbi:MFS transporter [Arcobacter sp. CECT 8983]|uniref:MFS transporter n=1 Tax=Arcobacter sp. CECT 8983 TaxID=2044508 RepID=UPI00100C0D49|nr:MFS transporter [Arcobacter sp. CECT 8983]RXJ90868.1 MFS transporter [Arcobacter sp. CECT 8983]